MAVVVLVGCSGSTSSGTGGGGGGFGGGTGAGTSGGGSATGGGTGGGTGDCVFLVNCASNCADTDQPCRDACGAQSTTLAITQYNALMTCSNNYSCVDAACVDTNCASELAACRGGGGTGGGGGTTGLTTSGKCEITYNFPMMPTQRSCWDYSLTVSTNHNDGVEHYFYYDSTLASGGLNTCNNSNNTFTAQQPGPWNDANISATNLSQKRQACQLANQMYTTATFTEGAACSSSGSLGHCTMTVTNVWNPSTTDLTATTTGTWSVP